MKKTGFSISNRNNSVGFRISLDNGYEVSVAFGDDTASGDTKIMEGRTGTDYFCEKAEIVVLNDKNQPIPFIKIIFSLISRRYIIALKLLNF